VTQWPAWSCNADGYRTANCSSWQESLEFPQKICFQGILPFERLVHVSNLESGCRSSQCALRASLRLWGAAVRGTPHPGHVERGEPSPWEGRGNILERHGRRVACRNTRVACATLVRRGCAGAQVCCER